MPKIVHHCQRCATRLRGKDGGVHRCKGCNGVFCGAHVYIWVDGANESITKNSPELCLECYVARHGYDE